MADKSFLSWPFFEDRHRALAEDLEVFAKGLHVDHADTDQACRSLVKAMGAAGWLQPTASEDGRRWMSAPVPLP
jgi:acyl-CoA dehydrogenase